MVVMQITAIALQGLDHARAQFEKSASRLARLGSGGGDIVDLSQEMVALLLAKNQFVLNTRLLRTADEMEGHMLDLLA